MVSPGGSGPIAIGADYEGFFKGIQGSPRPLFDMFRLKPTWQQDDVINFVEYEHSLPPQHRTKRVAIRSGQGTGKTTTMSVLTGFWRPMLATDGQSIITAPTSRQCREVFLGECRRLIFRAPKWFQRMVEIQHDRMNFCGRKTWGALTATATNDVNMQGFHNHLLTFYLEECSGISGQMIEQAKGTLTNEDAYLFACGNPNLRACEFYQMFYGPERLEWQRFWWDGEQSPIASKENQERLRREFGEDSDVYRVRVRGMFPRGNPAAIIDADKLTKRIGADLVAQHRLQDLPGNRYRYQIGIDLARYGPDESVIAFREGQAVVHMRTVLHMETIDVLDLAADLQEEMGWPDAETKYVVDAGGLGGGAMGQLYRRGKNVFEFNNGSRKCPKDFYNKITEGWWGVRNLVRDGQIALPQDRKLHDQLEQRTYKLADQEGQVRVRSKEEHVKDGLESPDRAEAVIYAFYNRTESGAQVSKKRTPRRQRSEQYKLGSAVFRRAQ